MPEIPEEQSSPEPLTFFLERDHIRYRAAFEERKTGSCGFDAIAGNCEAEGKQEVVGADIRFMRLSGMEIYFLPLAATFQGRTSGRYRHHSPLNFPILCALFYRNPVTPRERIYPNEPEIGAPGLLPARRSRPLFCKRFPVILQKNIGHLPPGKYIFYQISSIFPHFPAILR